MAKESQPIKTDQPIDPQGQPETHQYTLTSRTEASDIPDETEDTELAYWRTLYPDVYRRKDGRIISPSLRRKDKISLNSSEDTESAETRTAQPSLFAFRHQEKRESKKPKRRTRTYRPPKPPKPRQLFLSAIPGAYDRWENLPPEAPKSDEEITAELEDQIEASYERIMAIMHIPEKRMRIVQKELAHQGYLLLKALGLTGAALRERLEYKSARAVVRLKELGVWDMVLRKMTPQDRTLLHEITENETREQEGKPIVDYESSVGLTIYPSVAAWVTDHYGTFENDDEE